MDNKWMDNLVGGSRALQPPRARQTNGERVGLTKPFFCQARRTVDDSSVTDTAYHSTYRERH